VAASSGRQPWTTNSKFTSSDEHNGDEHQTSQSQQNLEISLDMLRDRCAASASESHDDVILSNCKVLYVTSVASELQLQAQFPRAVHAGPYANKAWGAAPKDMSYPVMTQDELSQAQQAAKVRSVCVIHSFCV
jgi:hypothetical protein